jgi:hypothetical protein
LGKGCVENEFLKLTAVKIRNINLAPSQEEGLFFLCQNREYFTTRRRGMGTINVSERDVELADLGFILGLVRPEAQTELVNLLELGFARDFNILRAQNPGWLDLRAVVLPQETLNYFRLGDCIVLPSQFRILSPAR